MTRTTLKSTVSLIIFLLGLGSANAQYDLKTVVDLDATNIKSQDITGTCWSYSTTSFIESELIRMGKGEHDLSEMYNVRMVYPEKATNYLRFHGKTQFSQGSLSHDVIRTIDKYGVVPESAYTGKANGEDKHNHSEMVAILQSILDIALKSNTVSKTWDVAFNAILDAYLGAAPEKFDYQGSTYTPVSFAKSLGLNADDYVSISSFTHHPYYESFVLEVPDNFSRGTFYNVTLDELVKVTNDALNNGFTLSWDADVSEDGFSSKYGMAILPEKDLKDMSDEERKEAFKKPVKEVTVTADNRQASFDNHSTTDDHLMHIVGMSKDKNGKIYYKVKNSWGTKAGVDGYMYVSEAYFRMKTISVMLHKRGIGKEISNKLNL